MKFYIYFIYVRCFKYLKYYHRSFHHPRKNYKRLFQNLEAIIEQR